MSGTFDKWFPTIRNTDDQHIIEFFLQMNTSESRRMLSPISWVITAHSPQTVNAQYCDTSKHICIEIPAEKMADQPPIMHSHNYYELMVVFKGNVRVKLESEIVTFKEGDVCLLNQHTHHAELERNDSVLGYLCFSKRFIDDTHTLRKSPLYPAHCRELESFFESSALQEEKQVLRFRCLNRTGLSSVSEPLALLQKELSSHEPGYQYILCGCVQRLFARICDPALYSIRHLSFPDLPERSIVDTVMKYIEEKHCRFSREDIENQLHYNRDYLNRIFHQYTGMTLGEYCRYVCMKEAADLLAGTELCINEIAEKVGYINRTQFYRLFHQYYHATPRQYRLFSRQIKSQDMPENPSFISDN